MKTSQKYVLALFAFLVTLPCFADQSIPLITSSQSGSNVVYSAPIQVLVLMTLLTFLPSIFITMTSFMRTIIVLSLLRQALGISQTPSNQILVGIAFFVTLFVMNPVFQKINTDAVAPYMNHTITLNQALDKAITPLKHFMLNQTRKKDLNFFVEMAGVHHLADRGSIPMTVVIPAFMTSELQTAFQIGFLLFIPFLIIDLVVSSTLMAMGMMMVSPMVISTPLKIMLFVMVDGWHLIFQTITNSFY